MIDLIISLLAILGGVIVGQYIVLPLLKAMLISIGYTFFFLWQLSLKKVLKNPFSTIKFLIQTILSGFFLSFEWGEINQVKQGKHVWKPYFHYEGFD